MASKTAAKAATQAAKSADHTLYHAEPTGFWKKFRDYTVVNPEISTGLPIPALNRYPPPASRPERYATPATSASDPAMNPYYKRDTRRQYPQTSVVSQERLTDLLLASPEGQKALPTPTSTEITTSSSKPTLTQALAALPSTFAAGGGGIAAGKASTTGGLPPSPPGFKWKPQAGDEIPHAPDAYWPMIGYK